MASASTAGRCTKHAEPLGAGGICARCAVATGALVTTAVTATRAADTAPDHLMDPLPWLAGLGVLLSLTGFAWAAAPLGALGARMLSAPQSAAVTPAPDPSKPAPAPPLAAAEPLVVAPAGHTAPAKVPLDLDDEPDPARAQAAVTAQNGATRTPSARELAEQDQKRHAEVEAQLRGHALTAARRDVVINMYSTSWCGACAKARAYMREQSIPFNDFDVDQDEAARARATTLNPRGSVPTITIDDQLLVGFSPSGMEDRIARAARRRANL